MQNRLRYVRFVYWFGALVDFYFVFALMVPRLWAVTLGLDDFSPDLSERFAIMTGASLMLGWTVLLLWADRQPIRRRFILILTFCPVIAGFLLMVAYDLTIGPGDLGSRGLILAKLLILSLLFTSAYHTASRIEKETSS